MKLTKWRSLLQIFHDDKLNSYGDLLTPTQIQIIDIIAKRRYPRTQLILPTQYGKSESVAQGVLMRISNKKEKWAIVAPTEDKARIIMDYIIDHIFDDPLFSEQLEYHGSKEQLKQHKSKLRISFRDGGEVRVYSGNATNTKATKNALMGFGAPNVILDESSLISDGLYATVKRMVGGTKDNFILEIGNPFERNHFHRTWFGSRYKKIYLNYEMALAEGRYTQEFIDEMREEAMFDVLYECIFPAANMILPNGYRRLVSDDDVDRNYIDALPVLTYKKDDNGNILKNEWHYDIIDDSAVLGLDPSGTGGNETKFIIRLPKHNVSFVAATMTTEDLDAIADKAIELAHQWNIGDYRIVFDAGGVGHGLRSIFRERGILAKGIMFGEAAPDKTFKNIRAYMYWQMRKNLKFEGGQLVRDEGFEEVKLVYYKRTSNDKTLIEPKDEMIKRNARDGRTVQSPDTADGLVLTFVDTSTIVEEDDIYFDD